MMLAYFLVATLLAGCAALLSAYRRAQRQLRDVQARYEETLKLNTQQQQALRDQRRHESVKDEFISTVSHELRTPLTSIRGALGLLSSGMLGHVDATAQNLLRIASTNTDRLVRLINDILDLERMDSERGELQVHRCSLPELIVQAVETMSTMAQNTGVVLEIAPGGEAIVFNADPDRILQLLCNLLSNAIKFSPSGARIRISTSVTDSDFLLRIEDEGRGIPAEMLETIFDRFQQVEPADSRQKGGTGLGLAICRSIAGQHGGAIWAERNDKLHPGRPGSTFVLQMPRLIASPDALTTHQHADGSILICDDDAGVRHILAEQLREHGYSVLEAEGGEQALQLAGHQPIEAILLDLYMPGLSGWETLDRLKQNPATADIPIVVLSALSPTARSSTGSSLIAAAQGWVQKPFTEQLLLAELDRVLRATAGTGRVLLVEDDKDLATVVLSGFAAHSSPDDEPVAVQHVRTLQEARTACLETPPEILILDLTLPDGTGFALVDWLRQQPSLSTLPTIIYSGRHLTEQEMSQLRLGPTQFLDKGKELPKDVENVVLSMVRHLRAPLSLARPAGHGTLGQSPLPAH